MTPPRAIAVVVVPTSSSMGGRVEALGFRWGAQPTLAGCVGMGMSRLLLPALLLVLALPTGADAAPPWSAPTPIPGTGPSFPSLVVSGDGTALAA